MFDNMKACVVGYRERNEGASKEMTSSKGTSSNEEECTAELDLKESRQSESTLRAVFIFVLIFFVL